MRILAFGRVSTREDEEDAFRFGDLEAVGLGERSRPAPDGISVPATRVCEVVFCVATCRVSPEAGGAFGAELALCATTMISGFCCDTLSVVALGLLTCFSTAALGFAEAILGKNGAVFATLRAWEGRDGDVLRQSCQQFKQC